MGANESRIIDLLWLGRACVLRSHLSATTPPAANVVGEVVRFAKIRDRRRIGGDPSRSYDVPRLQFPDPTLSPTEVILWSKRDAAAWSRGRSGEGGVGPPSFASSERVGGAHVVEERGVLVEGHESIRN